MTRKSIAQFDVVATRTAEDAEFYYSTVHVPMLRRLYAEHTDQVERYLPQRVLAKYDPAGGFNRPVDTWRFVVHHYRDTASAGISDHWRLIASRDHENFLENLRIYNVENETTVVDRRSGQTSLVKYLFRFSVESEGDRGRAERAVAEMSRTFEGTPGARLMVIDHIGNARQTTSLSRPGQLVTTESTTSDVGLMAEFYFDNRIVGDEFFADDRVRLPLLLDVGDTNVAGYRVDELNAYDAR